MNKKLILHKSAQFERVEDGDIIFSVRINNTEDGQYVREEFKLEEDEVVQCVRSNLLDKREKDDYPSKPTIKAIEEAG